MLNDSQIAFRGNLVADPTLRRTASNKAVSNFRVLVNHRERNAEGEWIEAEPTGWDCTVWGRNAELIADRLARGNGVVVLGRVHTEVWTTEDGEKRRKKVVTVDEIGQTIDYLGPDTDDEEPQDGV